MAENYNLNSNFGLNVTRKKAPEGYKSLSNNQSGVLDSLYTDEKNNSVMDVLDGKVADKINIFSRQAMIISMNLKAADQTKRNFDVNI